MSYKKLGDSIQNFIGEEDRLRNKFQSYTLQKLWVEVAGNTVARYTQKIVLHDKTLTLYINSAPLKQEILYSQEQLIEKINLHLKYQKIEKLVIQ
jgi:hypothetical protein